MTHKMNTRRRRPLLIPVVSLAVVALVAVTALGIAAAKMRGSDQPGHRSAPSAAAPASPSVTRDLGMGPRRASPGASPAGLPTPETTGWRHTGARLKTVSDRVYADKAGAAYDATDFRDGIVVRADNVTIKRSRVQCGDCPGIWVDWNVKNTTIQDVEVTSLSATRRIDRAITAGRTNNLTIRRVHVHNTQRGIEFGYSALIEDSWVDEAYNPTEAHSSAVGGDTSARFSLTIRRNWIAQPPKQNNSAAMLYYPGDTGSARQHVEILIEQNIFNGGTYCLWLSSAPQMTGTITVRNNLFGTKYFDTCGGYNTHFTDKLGTEGDATVTWQNNVWHAPGKAKHGRQVPLVIPQ